ncbi:hypothetical protein HHI36_005699, partial [Cryptolaemus montrouzieri]
SVSFSQNEAPPPNYARNLRKYLDLTFPGKWIGQPRHLKIYLFECLSQNLMTNLISFLA